jgi:hypothetical protein
MLLSVVGSMGIEWKSPWSGDIMLLSSTVSTSWMLSISSRRVEPPQPSPLTPAQRERCQCSQIPGVHPSITAAGGLALWISGLPASASGGLPSDGWCLAAALPAPPMVRLITVVGTITTAAEHQRLCLRWKRAYTPRPTPPERPAKMLRISGPSGPIICRRPNRHRSDRRPPARCPAPCRAYMPR